MVSVPTKLTVFPDGPAAPWAPVGPVGPTADCNRVFRANCLVTGGLHVTSITGSTRSSDKLAGGKQVILVIIINHSKDCHRQISTVFRLVHIDNYRDLYYLLSLVLGI